MNISILVQVVAAFLVAMFGGVLSAVIARTQAVGFTISPPTPSSVRF